MIGSEAVPVIWRFTTKLVLEKWKEFMAKGDKANVDSITAAWIFILKPELRKIVKRPKKKI